MHGIVEALSLLWTVAAPVCYLRPFMNFATSSDYHDITATATGRHHHIQAHTTPPESVSVRHVTVCPLFCLRSQ